MLLTKPQQNNKVTSQRSLPLKGDVSLYSVIECVIEDSLTYCVCGGLGSLLKSGGKSLDQSLCIDTQLADEDSALW